MTSTERLDGRRRRHSDGKSDAENNVRERFIQALEERLHDVPRIHELYPEPEESASPDSV